MNDESTRAKILAAAGRLFGDKGKNGVSTAVIAREAGVNKTLIFYHFGSKEELYLAVFTSWAEELKQTMDTNLGTVKPGLAMLEEFIRTHIMFLSKHTPMLRVMVRELLTGGPEQSPIILKAAEALKPFANHILVGVTAAKTRGEIRKVDPMHTLVNIISLNVFYFLGKPILTMVNPSVNPDKFEKDRIDHIVDFVINGLRARTE